MMKNGLMIALAFPDQFVMATEGRYNKILEWVGIVSSNNKVRAGHSAVVLICQRTGVIRYTDFGRYVTPEGKGRARSFLTDPEVTIPMKAQFDGDGRCLNLEEILFFFRDRSELTKGSGRCYAGVFEINFDRAWRYASEWSLRGSLPYGPFDIRGSNCSRYTWSTLKYAHNNWMLRVLMYLRFPPSIMPMDLVMLAKRGLRFEVSLSGLRACHFGQWEIWKRLFEKCEELGGTLEEKKVALGSKGNWLSGVGSQAFFNLVRVDEEGLLIERKDTDADVVFQHYFERHMDFDPEQNFEFVHDCNAAYCTIWQNGRQIKVCRLKKNGQTQTRPFNHSSVNSA